MEAIKNDSIMCFDVDDTLIIYEKPTHQTDADAIEINDPRCGHTIRVWQHNSHIKLLKQQKARGRLVIVWSNGGYEWAHIVIKKLALDAYVDYTMTKPLAVVDDSEVASGIVGTILYLNRDKYLRGKS